tara:strand:- start:3647 stop:3928 length:282 start_codon:yes stop_codon:yes gene_type:complete
VSIQTDSLDAIFSDFAVPVVAGGVSGLGVLDEPTTIVAGDQLISTEYVLHCKASSYSGIKAGDSVNVGGVAYTCRTNERDLDGLTCQISLSKN